MIEFVSPTYNGVRFFSRIISHERCSFFLSIGYFFPLVFPYKEILSLEIGQQDRFLFLKSPIPPPPLKVQWSAPN